MVSDSDRTPGVHLEVNQEVFLDVVRDGDVIEDATVATEVTSFERMGDAYVLEGAIVFAGYIPRGDGEARLDVDDILGFGPEDGHVEHVHHRMPFSFRVPVAAQSRSVMNVTSRISRWKLEVVGTGWVRVVADLVIFGLNADEGYHFQCGAQEEGDALFGQGAGDEPESRYDWDDDAPASTSDGEMPPPESSKGRTNAAHLEEDLELARGQKRVPETPEAISWARGGAKLDEEAQTQNETTREPESLAGALKQYDRALDGDRGPGKPGQSTQEHDTPDARTAPSEALDEQERSPLQSTDYGLSDASSTRDQPSSESAPVAEFEFEHQLSTDEMNLPVDATDAAESFSAARAFTEEGFQATQGFAPHVTYGSRPETNADGEARGRKAVEAQPEDAPLDEDTAVLEAAQAGERAETKPVSDMWSFVDFSAPERTYTIRFAIVLEDESVDDLAERFGCSKHELLRVNRLTSETALYAGQTLIIPSR